MKKSILCHIGANLGRKNIVGRNSFPMKVNFALDNACHTNIEG
jgi:hypothetical protein